MPAASVPVAVPPPANCAAPVMLPVKVPMVATMAPGVVPAAAEIFSPLTMMHSMFAVSEPAMLTVRTLPATLAVAPREPVEPTVLGVPLQVTLPAAGAAGVMVTVKEPAAFVAIDAIACSQNVSVVVLAEVPPTGTLPADVTVMAANAEEAAITVKSEASRVDVKPTLIAFFHLVKSCTSLLGLD
jgi:hypothetical protein